MFGFFKKKPAEPPATPQPKPVPAAAPPPPPPSAPSAPSAAALAAQPAPAVAPKPAGPTVEIPLRDVIEGLAPELKSLVRKAPGSGAQLATPLSVVQAQLASGSVKITFGELASWSPPGTFSSDGALNERPVSLPLKAILPKLPATIFQRRTDAQKVAVPDEVRPIFGGKGQILPQPKADPAPVPPPAPAAPVAAPAAVQIPKSEPPPALPAKKVVDPGPSISVDAAAVAAAAPAELKAAIPDSGTLQIPIAAIKPQLAQGQVQVSLGDLVEWGANINAAHPQLSTKISLPLGLILPKLPKEALQRNAAAKRIEVPEEVQGLFTSKAQITQEPPSAPAPTPVATTPIAFTPPPAPSSEKPPTPPTPPPGAFIKPPAPVTPAPAPAKLPGSTGVGVLPASAPKPAQPLPSAAPAALAPEPKTAAASLPAREPATRSDCIRVDVSKVWDDWGEDVQRVFITFPEAALEIPMPQLTEALRQGRAMFTWGEIQPWIQPNIGSAAASVFDDTPLMLPLPVLAPLFVRNLPKTTRRTVAIPDSIPDLFKSATSSPAEEAAVAQPLATPAAPAPTSELGKLFGTPEKVEWTPQEIVKATAALAGVQGALIATADGLVVSSQLPPELRAEAVAAFVPSLLTRAQQMAKELSIRDAAEVTITLAQTIIYAAPAGAQTLVAFGKRGLPFPVDSLNVIARELARK
ncbi:MAG TPA: roadblock/LC7 domain-containing protein [Methylomirabilota bacterium]|nr:roadblock/LC7 domain-containing protein [Methylomirabilota bacterium]